MEKGILRKRLKGLLALSLAFYLMFGNGIQVLAAGYDNHLVTEDQKFQSGDEIVLVTTGGATIYFDGNPVQFANENGYDVYKVTENLVVTNIDAGPIIYLERYNPNSNNSNPGNTNPGNTPQNPPTDPNGNQEAAKASSGGTHTHSLRWEIVQEPTETVDGRSEYRCECGHVEAAQPISFFGAIIKRIIKSIEEAPQNGTVVVENKFLRCLTDEIMEALHKRSDVNLEVKFSEQGVNYHFLIPATAAPTEEEEWFGYFYLGGRYGWLQ